MEKLSKLMTGFGGKFSTVSGDCEKHGPADMVVRNDSPWACPQCFHERIVAEDHQKWVDERASRLMHIASIPPKYVGQRFVAHTPAQKSVRGAAKAFRDFILESPRWAALILVGSVGTGKTLLACEFAESLIKGMSRSAKYITAKGMINEIQASYSLEGKTEEGEIERFVQYDLLILDEIDAKPDRENANLLLTEIINRRYSNDKPVIAITNQPFDDLARFVGDRVDDRLHENAFVCGFDWPSFRRNPVPAEKVSP